MGACIIAQSMHFMVTMVQIVKSRYVEYKERKQKKVQMRWFEALNKEELDKIEAYKKKPSKKQYVP